MTIHHNPIELLQNLIRFDTTNPPGNELACIMYLADILRDYGIEPTLIANDPNRPNLIARLKGRGEAPPLLLQGHVDVVPVEGQEWTHPPFSAEIHDEYVWGRGALDMKGGVAMMVCAFLSLKAQTHSPAGDIILCIMSDEEGSAEDGAKFLVEQHAEQFEGVQFGIGEFGGFPFEIAGKRFYPIQVAEKVGCYLKITIRGQAGHGSMPVQNGAMAKLGRILTRLDKKQLPIQIAPTTRLMVEAIADNSDAPINQVLRGLLNPRLTNQLLKTMPQLGALAYLFRNTISPTVLKSGVKTNVIPGQIDLIADGRMLPGVSAENFISEVKAVIQEDVEIEQVGQGVPQKATPDMRLFPLLADVIKSADRSGIPVPYMLPAVTDGRWFSKLGIQHYGFLPLNLPSDFNFSAFVHAADERVPVKSIHFGTYCLIDMLKHYRLD